MAIVLVAGLVLRVVVQFSYRPALFYIDTPRYLYNAHGMDPVGYKAPLVAIAFLAGFAGVAAVQHLLGVAIALVVYVVLARAGVSRLLAALATAPVLLDAYQLQAEQSIMPGIWFEALIIAGLATLVWRPSVRWQRALAASVILGMSATVAQVGEALLLPGLIYLFAALRDWRRAVRVGAVFCLGFALPIVCYAVGSEVLAGSFFLSHTGATALYGRMAAAADCATISLPAAERGMCPTKAEQAKGSDWLEYGQGSPIRPYYADPNRDRTDRAITDFNYRVLSQQPGRVLRAYGRDVLKIFAWSRVTSPGDTPISRWQFQRSYPFYPVHATRKGVLAMMSRYGGGEPAVWRAGTSFLRAYQLDGSYTPGLLFAVLAAAGIAGSLVGVCRNVGAVVRMQALSCLAFFAAAAAVLLASDVFEFSWRYQLPALVTIVPAGALGVSAICASKRLRASGLAESISTKPAQLQIEPRH